MTGPAGIKPFMTILGLSSPPIFIYYFYCSSFVYMKLNLVYLFIIGVLFILSIYNSFIVSFKDPGNLPRRVMIDTAIITKHKMNVFHKGILIKMRICKVCNICKPLRSHHCGDCDNCIEHFDHHCPWLGVCIGKRNYSNFIFFLINLILIKLMIVISCLYQIEHDFDVHKKAYIDNLIDLNKINLANFVALSHLTSLIYLVIYCIINLILWFSLFVYHINLIYVNNTTKEQIKKPYYLNYIHNIFDRKSFLKNVEYLICRKLSRFTLQYYIIKNYALKLNGNDIIDEEMCSVIDNDSEHLREHNEHNENNTLNELDNNKKNKFNQDVKIDNSSELNQNLQSKNIISDNIFGGKSVKRQVQIDTNNLGFENENMMNNNDNNNDNESNYKSNFPLNFKEINNTNINANSYVNPNKQNQNKSTLNDEKTNYKYLKSTNITKNEGKENNNQNKELNDFASNQINNTNTNKHKDLVNSQIDEENLNFENNKDIIE